MIGLREAGPADLDRIAACGVQFAAESGISQFLPRTHAEVRRGVERLMAVPGVKVWLAEHEGQVMGGLGMIYSPGLWQPDVPHAEELFYWASQAAPATAALRLLKTADADMRAHGIRTRTFYRLPGSPEKVTALYERMGMREAQTAYTGFV